MNNTKTRRSVLHSSRPVEIEATELTMAKDWERVMGLKRGAVKVALTEHPELSPCVKERTPHVHYDVVTEYDDTQTLGCGDPLFSDDCNCEEE